MCGVFREGVAVKFEQIEQLRHQHRAVLLCRLLGVSESGYRAWRKRPPSARQQEAVRLEAETRAAHQLTRATYSPKRFQSDPADHGIAASLDRIKRIRRKLGLRCKQKRKLKTTTDSRHPLPLAPNRLNRQFTVEAPNQA